MRRIFSAFTAALIFCLLALSLSTPAGLGTAKAADNCEECMVKVNQAFETCLAVLGPNDIRCYDLFNDGVVVCYATVCEQ